jgi:hypothetical protein
MHVDIGNDHFSISRLNAHQKEVEHRQLARIPILRGIALLCPLIRRTKQPRYALALLTGEQSRRSKSPFAVSATAAAA